MTQEIPQNNKDNTQEQTLSSSVLERIEKESVTPVPKWQFLLGEYGIWLLWVLSVVIGAIAVSVMIFVSVHAGFAMYEATHETPLSFFIEVLPYVWILLFISMAGLAYFNMRNTKKGYKYPLWQIVGSSLLLSVVAGSVLHYAGVGYVIDSQLNKRVPLFPSFEKLEAKMWQVPNEGRILGTFSVIENTDGEGVFVDVDGTTWTLDTTELFPPDLRALFSGKKVRILGVVATSTATHFHGCGVFPWLYDAPVPAKIIRQERNAFVNRMVDHAKRAEEYRVKTQRELATSSMRDDTGICARQVVIKRLKVHSDR